MASEAASEQVQAVLKPVVADVKLQGLIARANSDDAKAFDELLMLWKSDKALPSPQKELISRIIANLEREGNLQIQFLPSLKRLRSRGDWQLQLELPIKTKSLDVKYVAEQHVFLIGGSTVEPGPENGLQRPTDFKGGTRARNSSWPGEIISTPRPYTFAQACLLDQTYPCSPAADHTFSGIGFELLSC